MLERGEKARFGESYARQRKAKNCFVDPKERVEKLLAVVRNEKSNVVLLGRQVLPKAK